MTITDLDLARACADTYAGTPPTWNTEDVHAYLFQRDGYAIIAFEGSASVQDWLQDFDAAAIPRTIDHIELGWVHDGFAEDVEEVFEQIVAGLPSDPIAITGHSKGAAEALIFAALLHAHLPYRNIARVSTFGTPRPGRLNGLLDGLAGADYRNRDDPVCAVPPYLERPRLITHLDAAPMADDPWGPLACHHIQLYIEGVRKLVAEQTPPT